MIDFNSAASSVSPLTAIIWCFYPIALLQHKTKTRKTVTNSNLIPASNTSSEIITDQPINGFDTPGKGNDTAVKSNISGAHFMGGDEEISNDILGAYQSEPEEEIHDKNIEMESSVSKVNVHWEHFALLVEEYLLAIDVKM